MQTLAFLERGGSRGAFSVSADPESSKLQAQKARKLAPYNSGNGVTCSRTNPTKANTCIYKGMTPTTVSLHGKSEKEKNIIRRHCLKVGKKCPFHTFSLVQLYICLLKEFLTDGFRCRFLLRILLRVPQMRVHQGGSCWR